MYVMMMAANDVPFCRKTLGPENRGCSIQLFSIILSRHEHHYEINNSIRSAAQRKKSKSHCREIAAKPQRRVDSVGLCGLTQLFVGSKLTAAHKTECSTNIYENV